MQQDLFQIERVASAPPAGEKKKRKATKPNGYAALPGTGPEGETCGSCAHHVRTAWSRTYHKCGLNRVNWTHGPGSDIRVRSAACSRWEKSEEKI